MTTLNLFNQLQSLYKNPDLIIENHFPLLNQGNFRSVYLAKDDNGNNIVFKITHDCWKGEWVGNNAELETFNDIKSLFPFLLPYILNPINNFRINNTLFLIYPKVTTTFPSLSNRSELFTNHLKVIKKVFYDTSSNNLGIFNNLPILLDYDQGFSIHEADLMSYDYPESNSQETLCHS